MKEPVKESADFGKNEELDWPTFGDLGKLSYADLNDTIQCHMCGKYYKHLGVHIVTGHKVHLDWYRDRYGFNRQFGFANEKLKTQSSERLYNTLDNGLHEKLAPVRRKIREYTKDLNRPGRKLSEQAKEKMRGKPPAWYRHAGKDEREAWAKKINEKGMELIDAQCAKCGIDIKTTAKHKSVTYCNECRRLAYNEVQRRHRAKRKMRLLQITK